MNDEVNSLKRYLFLFKDHDKENFSDFDITNFSNMSSVM